MPCYSPTETSTSRTAYVLLSVVNLCPLLTSDGLEIETAGAREHGVFVDLCVYYLT